jgi:hypothetical protein
MSNSAAIPLNHAGRPSIKSKFLGDGSPEKSPQSRGPWIWPLVVAPIRVADFFSISARAVAIGTLQCNAVISGDVK